MHQLVSLIAARGNIEPKAPEMALDPVHSEKERGQSSQIGIAGAQCQIEFWRCRGRIGTGMARQCDSCHGGSDRGQQDAVLQFDLQGDVLYVSGQA